MKHQELQHPKVWKILLTLGGLGTFCVWITCHLDFDNKVHTQQWEELCHEFSVAHEAELDHEALFAVNNKGEPRFSRHERQQALDVVLSQEGPVNLAQAQLQDLNLEGANLNRAQLKGANLSKANLNRAQLKKANLKKANLNRANLVNADFTSARCQKADFSEAILNATHFEQAFLNDVNFDDCYFFNSNLTHASIEGASFQRADLSRTVGQPF